MYKHIFRNFLPANMPGKEEEQKTDRCKAIRKKRDGIFELEQKINNGGHADGNQHEQFGKVGDLLVEIGYRESNTLAHGIKYYQEALKYYIMQYKCLPLPAVENKIFLLIIVLGGDEDTIKTWCTEIYCSVRAANYMPAEKYVTNMEQVAAAQTFGLHLLARDDVSHQLFCLLSQMKLLASYRQNLHRLEVFKETIQNNNSSNVKFPLEDVSKLIFPYLMGDMEDGPNPLDILPDKIRLFISAIQFHGNESYLIHLRDTIPLREAHCPELFYDSEGALPEFWMIFQYICFETRGVRDVLCEFFPEE